MKRRVMLFVLVFGFLAASSTFAADALTAGEKLAIESLIKQFGDRQFSTRQAAVTKLVDIGPKVVPVVQAALLESEDKEVKLRCQMVLDGIAKKYGTALTAGGGVAAPGKFGIEASKVTIKVADADLDEVLQMLAERSGNKLVKQPDEWEEKTISINVTDMPYWQALDEVCRKTGLAYVGDMRTGALTLMPVTDGVDIGAYAGPAVVKLTNGTRRENFRGVQTRMRQREGLTYQLSYYLEDRLKPLSVAASITKAIAPDGKELLAPAPAAGAPGAPGAPGVRRFVMRMMPNRGGSVGTINVNIEDVPKGLETIAQLEGSVKLTFGTGKTQLKIQDVFGEGERSVQDGDAVVKVARAMRNGGFGMVSLTQTVDGKDEPVPTYPADSGYGFELIDPDGGVHKATTGFGGRGGPGGNRRGRGGNRAPAGGGQNNPRQNNRNRRNRRDRGANRDEAMNDGVVGGVLIPVQNVQPAQPGGNNQGGRRGGQRGQRGQRGGRRGFAGMFMGRGGAARFQNLPDIEGQWTLVYTKPLKSTEKTFDFTIKDVPLP